MSRLKRFLPKTYISYFRYILDNFGVWCAVRGALLLVVRLEKMKMREKYERHYLVLGLATNAISFCHLFCHLKVIDFP